MGIWFCEPCSNSSSKLRAVYVFNEVSYLKLIEIYFISSTNEIRWGVLVYSDGKKRPFGYENEKTKDT